jgi:hypothetical protein
MLKRVRETSNDRERVEKDVGSGSGKINCIDIEEDNIC